MVDLSRDFPRKLSCDKTYKLAEQTYEEYGSKLECFQGNLVKLRKERGRYS